MTSGPGRPPAALLLAAALAAAAPQPAGAADEAQAVPDPLELVARAREAVDALRSVRFDFEYRGTPCTGSAVNPLAGALSGSARLGRGAVRGNHRFDVSLRGGFGGEAVDARLVTDGIRAWRIDHGAAEVLTGDVIAGARIWLRPLAPALPPEIADPDVFARAGVSGTLRWLARVEEGDGVACHLVHWHRDTADGSRDRWWCLGVEDHLPRRIRRISRSPGRHAEALWRLSAVHAGAPGPAEAFAAQAPEGYRVRADGGPYRRIGEAAPAWELHDDDGRLRSLQALRGRRVLLYFYGGECEACESLAPVVERLGERLDPQRIALVGARVGAAAGDAFDFPVVPGRPLIEPYRVHVLPALIVVDADGRYEQLLMPADANGLDAVFRRLSGVMDRLK